ncbi:MAG: hypothetical protein ACI4A5_06260 [Hominilimicola sp.]
MKINDSENTKYSMPQITMSEMAWERHNERMARSDLRKTIIIIVLILALLICNLAWLGAWMSYDYESYDMDSGENGYINFIGGDGDITDGKGEITPKD